jgi:hypothetical protein
MQQLLLLFKRDITRLEYDPATQYRFHFAATWLWFVAIVVVPFFPSLYAHQLPALIIQEVSLWANFATHFGSMSSALAAKAGQPPVLTVSQNPINPDLLPGSVVTPTPADIQHDFESGLLE